jgi:hypothetical protein
MNTATEIAIAAKQDGPLEAGRRILTHSSEAAFKTCPRRYYLSYQLGLRPAFSSDALRMGNAFHIGLESAKHGNDATAAATAVRDAYADADCPPWLDREEFEVEQETAVALVLGWMHKWKDDRICEYVAIEHSFELPILNPTTGRVTPSYNSGGKIDAICRLPDDRLAIVEHKTTSESIEPGSDYWNRLLMDSQISRYVLAARQSGFDVRTTVYDVTRKPQIRPRQTTKQERSQGTYYGLRLDCACPDRETPQMYGARLLTDLVTRPEFYFARMEIPRLDADLSEFQAEQWTIQRAIRESELNERNWGAAAWPRNTGACLFPYRCQFFDVCRGLSGNPQEQIPDGFKRVDVLHPELVNRGTES